MSPWFAILLRLHDLRQSIKDERLLGFLDSILEDQVIGNDFRKAPAAAKIHQAYLRGLMEHSIGVAEIAQSIATTKSSLNLRYDSMVWKQINVFPSLSLVSAVATLVIGMVTKKTL